jgi:uncharacterized membrane-anchored protein
MLLMRTILLTAIIGLQCVWILGTTFTQERSLHSDPVVLLETQPVDPRDLLRGDYVILNYKISNVPLNRFTPPALGDLPDGTPVFVALTPSTNQFYEIATASLESFTPQPGQVLLKGKTHHWWNGSGEIRVEYGLETYYVPEGTGNPRGKVTVTAAVGKGGTAAIKQVFVDGVPYLEAVKKQRHSQ